MLRPAILSTLVLGLSALEVEAAKLATADASPLDPGTYEVALGASWTRAGTSFDGDGHGYGRGGDLTELGGSVGLTVGLIDGLDAGVGIGWTRIEDDAADPSSGSGPTDLELGAKWRFWACEDDDAAWALALLPAVTVPLGRGQDPDADIPTASRCWTVGLALAGSGNIGALAVNADIGYTRALGGDGDREGYAGTLAADAAVGWQIADGVQPEIDVSWARDHVDEGTSPWALALTAGVQLGLPIGRLGLGVQRTVAGVEVDRSTSVLADLAIALP